VRSSTLGYGAEKSRIAHLRPRFGTAGRHARPDPATFKT